MRARLSTAQEQQGVGQLGVILTSHGDRVVKRAEVVNPMTRLVNLMFGE